MIKKKPKTTIQKRSHKKEALKKNDDENDPNRILLLIHTILYETEEIKRIDYTVLQKIQCNN